MTFYSNVNHMSDEEREFYIDYVKQHCDCEWSEVESITVIADGEDHVKISYSKVCDSKFERVRRITGYLSKTSNWNNAKQAELHDRTKHA